MRVNINIHILLIRYDPEYPARYIYIHLDYDSHVGERPLVFFFSLRRTSKTRVALPLTA